MCLTFTVKIVLPDHMVAYSTFDATYCLPAVVSKLNLILFFLFVGIMVALVMIFNTVVWYQK